MIRLFVMTALALGVIASAPQLFAQSTDESSVGESRAEDTREPTKKPAVYTAWTNNKAVDGYDPLSFFSGSPRKGEADYVYAYQGALWVFTSVRNRDTFIGNPERYAPAYGGYCAWAIAQGKLAKGNPEFWTIVDWRLYLNYNHRIQKRWSVDQANFIATANENWPDILNQ